MQEKAQLAWALATLSKSQGVAVDQMRLEGAFVTMAAEQVDAEVLRGLCSRLGFTAPVALTQPDQAQLPLLCRTQAHGWGLLLSHKADGSWLFAQESGDQLVLASELKGDIYRVRPLGTEHDTEHQSFERQFKQAFKRHRGVLWEAGLATVFINLLAVAVSMFSMQVYDRVIPTGATGTLFILASGVALILALDVTMKFARARIMDSVVTGVDEGLSRDIFQRLLAVRVDQFPGSVGSLAGQLRGYEQIRSFYTTTTLFTMVDLPMGLVFIALIAVIGHHYVSAVPLILGVMAVLVGISARKRLAEQAKTGLTGSNQKMGLLVEAVEGVETIKAGSGGWKFLARWLDINAETLVNDLRMRHTNETISYTTGTIYQVAYTGTVAVGALMVIQGEMTMGSLIACSILSGRVLQPIMQIPGILVQHANARAAMEGMEKMYQLETDHQGVARPLVPSRLAGTYTISDVEFAYPGGGPALKIANLHINAGERVGILGPIGSGKSTLLRLLSGLYRTKSGQITLDNMDLKQIDRTVLANHVGYLQQEHRLFQGTLRDNLLIGMNDPGDDAMKLALETSGLIQLVSAHPRGLDLPITEGGKGLSGGQKQLVAYTRLLLYRPDIWLLDEPTASMDGAQENVCLNALRDYTAGKTLIVVTHKPSILPLVDRLIVIAGGQVVMDGPKQMVLDRLAKGSQTAAAPSSTPSVGGAQS
jgi:ATP-binding cassette, subfamily C, bacterial LapB